MYVNLLIKFLHSTVSGALFALSYSKIKYFQRFLSLTRITDHRTATYISNSSGTHELPRDALTYSAKQRRPVVKTGLLLYHIWNVLDASMN